MGVGGQKNGGETANGNGPEVIEAIAYEPSTIRDELIALYKATGMTTGEYSRRVGISDSSVKNLLAGVTEPSIEVLRRMAVYHKVAFLVHGRRRRMSGRFTCLAKAGEREVRDVRRA